jgi:hypothetical protein
MATDAQLAGILARAIVSEGAPRDAETVLEYWQDLWEHAQQNVGAEMLPAQAPLLVTDAFPQETIEIVVGITLHLMRMN